MKPVDQEFLHRPEIGQRGDCLRACIASILELPLNDVPHFVGMHAAPADAWNAVYDWLEERGYVWSHINRLSTIEPDAHYIISGPSPRGNGRHAVVGKGKEIAFDPHPSRLGLGGSAVVWSWAELVKERA